MASDRFCPHCGKKIVGHPNKKFCNSTCKDRYHNEHNPRGIFAHLEPRRFSAQDREDAQKEAAFNSAMEAVEGPGWDAHKVWKE